MKPEEGGCWPTPVQENLLKAALCDGEIALIAWREWRDTVSVSSVSFENLDRASQRLLPLLEHNLKRLSVGGAELLPFRGLARRTWHENQMILAQGAVLVRGLQNAGFRVLVFKGSALSLRYYADVALRPMNDFDLLVPTSQAKKAFAWVLENGWEFDAGGDLALLTDVFLENQHGYGFRNAEGRSFDLHRHLLHQSCGAEADNDFWDATIPLAIHGTQTLTLCDADHLLAMLLHGVRWDDTSPLRWVADAMTILRGSATPFDWNRVLDQAQKRGLVLQVQAGLRYLRATFDAPIPNFVELELAQMPVTRWQKLEFIGWTTSHRTHSPLMRLYLRLLCFNKWEISRGWRGKVFGLPLYLQHAWLLRSPWQLPGYAWIRTVRQARAHLQSRFR